MADNTLAFELRLKAISKSTAEAVERLAKVITELVEEEDMKGYHLYSRYVNWPLIAELKAGGEEA